MNPDKKYQDLPKIQIIIDMQVTMWRENSLDDPEDESCILNETFSTVILC